MPILLVRPFGLSTLSMKLICFRIVAVWEAIQAEKSLMLRRARAALELFSAPHPPQGLAPPDCGERTHLAIFATTTRLYSDSVAVLTRSVKALRVTAYELVGLRSRDALLHLRSSGLARAACVA